MRYIFFKKLPILFTLWESRWFSPSSLSRARSRWLRLRPWRLEYGPSSTFAQLGVAYNINGVEKKERGL